MSYSDAGRNLSRRTLPPALHLVKAYGSPALALSLRILPRLAKFVAYLLILLNVRSLPFAWHSMAPHYLLSPLITYLFMAQSTCFGPSPR